MSVALTYPGVYIEEVSSGVRTITGVATSITAFVGRALRGPVDDDDDDDENGPVRIFSFADYERIFGGLWVDSPMSFAVYHYFLNGGTDALVVRVHKGAKAGTGDITLLDLSSTATFKAANPGRWADRLRVRVDNDIDESVALDNPPDTLFNLHVKDLGTGVTESHLNLSITPGAPRFVGEVLKHASKLLRGPAAALALRPKPSDPATHPDPFDDDTATKILTLASDGDVVDDT
jgi:hypothetical protein